MSKTMVAGLVLAVLSMGADCFLWSPGLQDNAVVYACAGGTLSLPWNLTLSGGDSVMNIQWFYSGRSEELIATEVHGQFLILPAFSGRVRKISNVGIEIDGVAAIAKGNYSVEVVGQSAAGAVTTLRRSVYVFISDGRETTDEHLHVTQHPVAEYDNSTHQYQVVLRCGTFTHPTRLPFEVTWQTPSGQTEQSSSYKDGSFLLKLPNPVEGGTYTCRLPPSAACLHDNRTGEATLTVDKMEARLAVLEARQASLENVDSELKTRVRDVESNNSDLTTKYNALESKNSELKTRVRDVESKNSALESKNSDLTTKYNALESKNNDLTTKYNALKTEKDVLENLLLNQTVSFHARLDTEKVDLPAGSTLILPIVVNNHGNAYDGSTGKFTAPYTATYCFLATTVDGRNDHVSVLSLVVDGTEVDYVLTNVASVLQSASVHAVLHLTAGQKVWLNVPTTNNYFGNRATAFSGFLVDHSQ